VLQRGRKKKDHPDAGKRKGKGKTAYDQKMEGRMTKVTTSAREENEKREIPLGACGRPQKRGRVRLRRRGFSSSFRKGGIGGGGLS